MTCRRYSPPPTPASDRLPGRIRHIKIVRARGARLVSFTLANRMEDLPFAPSFFDCVVRSFGIGRFSAPERALAEFARVLAPKGRVALSWWMGLKGTE